MGSRRSSAAAPAAAVTTANAEVTAVQQKQEEKAVAQEKQALTEASARLRLMQTGGLRLLFSPLRMQTSEGTQMNKSLGSGI